MVDLGAAPGGWTQVAVQRGAARVVAVDLLPVDPVAGAVMLLGDFIDPAMQERLVAVLGGKADLVLSDMAPNTTGHAATDHLRIMALAEAALAFALEVLAEGGGFVAKVFQGGAEQAMLERLKRHFATVRHAKPPASRKESSELYVVATGFRGGGGHSAVGLFRGSRPLTGASVGRGQCVQQQKMEPQNTQNTQTNWCTAPMGETRKYAYTRSPSKTVCVVLRVSD